MEGTGELARRIRSDSIKLTRERVSRAEDGMAQRRRAGSVARRESGALAAEAAAEAAGVTHPRRSDATRDSPSSSARLAGGPRGGRGPPSPRSPRPSAGAPASAGRGASVRGPTDDANEPEDERPATAGPMGRRADAAGGSGPPRPPPPPRGAARYLGSGLQAGPGPLPLSAVSATAGPGSSGLRTPAAPSPEAPSSEAPSPEAPSPDAPSPPPDGPDDDDDSGSVEELVGPADVAAHLIAAAGDAADAATAHAGRRAPGGGAGGPGPGRPHRPPRPSGRLSARRSEAGGSWRGGSQVSLAESSASAPGPALWPHRALPYPARSCLKAGAGRGAAPLPVGPAAEAAPLYGASDPPLTRSSRAGAVSRGRALSSLSAGGGRAGAAGAGTPRRAPSSRGDGTPRGGGAGGGGGGAAAAAADASPALRGPPGGAHLRGPGTRSQEEAMLDSDALEETAADAELRGLKAGGLRWPDREGRGPLATWHPYEPEEDWLPDWWYGEDPGCCRGACAVM